MVSSSVVPDLGKPTRKTGERRGDPRGAQDHPDSHSAVSIDTSSASLRRSSAARPIGSEGCAACRPVESVQENAAEIGAAFRLDVGRDPGETFERSGEVAGSPLMQRLNERHGAWVRTKLRNRSGELGQLAFLVAVLVIDRQSEIGVNEKRVDREGLEKGGLGLVPAQRLAEFDAEHQLNAGIAWSSLRGGGNRFQSLFAPAHGPVGFVELNQRTTVSGVFCRDPFQDLFGLLAPAAGRQGCGQVHSGRRGCVQRRSTLQRCDSGLRGA
jgi:hypothetical protein